MLPVISLLILALAVSLDGFGVGVMYGLRKIKIPLLSIVIISLWSGIIICGSMQIGVWMSSFLTESSAKRIGAVILIGIGIWALVQMLKKHPDQEDVDTAEAPAAVVASKDVLLKARQIVNIELKRFGLVIQILRTPSKADVDKSGNISASEATLLGLALSLDAFGAGIGAALIGFKPLITSTVIAVSSGTFIALGMKVGFQYAGMEWMKRLSFVPGCILILMGIMKLM
jgi:putative sporulation protein YtaF